jgi:hypothetical protein
MTFPIADRGLLMKWHEPNAYFRKNLTLGFLIKFYALLAVLLLIISPRIIRNNPQHPIIIMISLYLFLCAVFVLSQWFGSASSVVRLKKDAITKTNSGRSYFKNIENCNVYSESYKGTKFIVLKLTLKKKDILSFLKPKQVSEVAVPENVNFNQVLQILRDKGVKVVEAPLPS